jgi:pimeloyl-ACP methyl ester carboxylesterase
MRFTPTVFIIGVLFAARWSMLSLAAEENSSALNLFAPTLGGTQFWTDEIVFREWRVQRNCVSGHYRLLDAENWRIAWGDLRACRERLERERREQAMPPLSPRVIVLLHGLGRTRGSMSQLQEYLATHTTCDVLRFSYASSRNDVDAHAAALGRVIANLEGVAEVDFVAHSLGNIVVRRYLAAHALESHPRIRRMVMLAPPNQGSAISAALDGDPLFRALAGASGEELGDGWTKLQKKLATPRDFAIVAGSITGNVLLDGDDDLVVRVEETRLAGAADFAIVPLPHTTIMNDPEVQEMTLQFLEEGFLRSEESRQSLR